MKHFLILSAIFALLFIPYFSFPLDDDVGAPLVMAKGILDGKHAYSDLFDNKGPFLYLLMAPAVVFAGASLLKLRFLALLFLFAYAFLVYSLASRAKNEKFALASAAIFYFLALNPVFQSYELRNELFLGFLVTLMAFSAGNRSRHSDFLMGFALACGILIKISFVVFLLPCIYYAYLEKGSFRKFAAGIAVAAMALAAMIFLGIFSPGDYIYNGIVQPAEFSSAYLLIKPVAQLYTAVASLPLALAQLAALAYFAITFRSCAKGLRPAYAFYGVLAIAVFSGLFSLGVHPALQLLFLPCVSIALPLMLASAKGIDSRPSAKAFIAIGTALFVSLLLLATVLSGYFGIVKDGAVPGANVKPTLLSKSEELGLVSFIEANTLANDTISAFPAMPNIYYLASRYPPSQVLWYPPVGKGYSYYDLEKYFFGPISAKAPKYVLLQRGVLDAEFESETAGRISGACPYLENVGRVEIYGCR